MLSDGKANHGAVTVVYVDPHGLLFFLPGLRFVVPGCADIQGRCSGSSTKTGHAQHAVADEIGHVQALPIGADAHPHQAALIDVEVEGL